MTEKTRKRAYSNPILFLAIQEGQRCCMDEVDIFESLVHYLLDRDDRAEKEKLDRIKNSLRKTYLSAFPSVKIKG